MEQQLTPLGKAKEEIFNIWNTDENFSNDLHGKIEMILINLLPEEREMVEKACNDTGKYLTAKEIPDLGKIYFETNLKQQ